MSNDFRHLESTPTLQSIIGACADQTKADRLRMLVQQGTMVQVRAAGHTLPKPIVSSETVQTADAALRQAARCGASKAQVEALRAEIEASWQA